ncbi:hypothetical protein Ahy_B05g078136 [Arachis hypogaea]|uniref:RNase H type-1 domain-containing protein n=1 Tax=Arachis hypogaea TaxID=3818 RepID=A0A444Z6E6_ARAHY|nr:hypothetical protein Ahy_B05g078136 [Arachis hypogaea]
MKSSVEKKALEVADGDCQRVEEQVKNIPESPLNIDKEREGNNDKTGRKLKMIVRDFEEQRRIYRKEKERGGPNKTPIRAELNEDWAESPLKPNVEKHQKEDMLVEKERNMSIGQLLKDHVSNKDEEIMGTSLEAYVNFTTQQKIISKDIEICCGYKEDSNEMLQSNKQIYKTLDGDTYFVELVDEDENQTTSNDKAITIAKDYEMELAQRMQNNLSLKRRRNEEDYLQMEDIGSFVYGNPNYNKRKDQWRSITAGNNNEGVPQLFIGDFNDILSQEEKVGLHPKPQNQIQEFRQFVNSNSLMDLDLKGGKFTWFSNPRNGFVTREKIDRALANWEWMSMYQNASLSLMSAVSSDHCPLILDVIPVHRVRKYFKFEAYWADHEDCSNVVKRGWCKEEQNGDEWDKISRKINNCKEELKKTGYYAAKEDYLARNQENPSTSTDKRDLWREIWKMEVPPKIKMHLWKASQNILPVYTILYKKRILDSPLCQICLKQNESVEHALLLCEWVRAVWFGAECQCIPTTETVSSLENWLMDNIKKIRAEGGEDQEKRISRIGFLLWEVWKSRNDKLFQQKEINPSWTIKKAKLLEYSYWSAAGKKAETRTVEIRRRNANLVRWRPPPNDWLKVNVDATFKKESGNGTISAVVRDKEGKVLLGFTGKIQANSSIIAEAMAIRQALIIVNNLQLGKTLIESDNQRLVQAIKSKSSIGRAWAIIQDIQILLEALPEKGLTWTPRNGNLLAHAVAKAAEAETLSPNWSLQPPTEICNIIQKESLRTQP